MASSDSSVGSAHSSASTVASASDPQGHWGRSDPMLQEIITEAEALRSIMHMSAVRQQSSAVILHNGDRKDRKYFENYIQELDEFMLDGTLLNHLLDSLLVDDGTIPLGLLLDSAIEAPTTLVQIQKSGKRSRRSEIAC